MTIGTKPPSGPTNQTSRTYFDHSSAPRINTDAVLVRSLRSEYPNLHLTVVPQISCNLPAYAAAGHAALAPIDTEPNRLSWRTYLPPATRLDGAQGFLADNVKFARYLLDWQGREFVVVIAEGRDGSSAYPAQTNQYILSSSIEATNRLLLTSGQWSSTPHEEILVFDGGRWQKSHELWESVSRSSWSDVILPSTMKAAIRADVASFFASRETYERLKVPWKRGIIYHGPPGNGKTISIKATMHALSQQEPPIPTLYVRSLSSFAGPEYSLNAIFSQARRTAPCYLVFEDLDSIISDSSRSYFLNEVDGIKKNDGILMLGSTNHLDRLDPGLAKRPSRFDRKYLFDNPKMDGRTQYAKYWQGKLKENDELEFPDALCEAFAGITDGFSFAYMQEAMVASLLALARESEDEAFSEERVQLKHEEDGAGVWKQQVSAFERVGQRAVEQKLEAAKLEIEGDDPELSDVPLWRELRKQVRILREEMDDAREEKRAGGRAAGGEGRREKVAAVRGL